MPAISRITTSGTSLRGISPAIRGAMTAQMAIHSSETNDDSMAASSSTAVAGRLTPRAVPILACLP